MKVQKIKVRSKGGPAPITYYKTYLNIPKDITEYMLLKKGTQVFLGIRSKDGFSLRKNRRYATDTPCRLTESVIGKYKGTTYTILRLILPTRIVDIIGIQQGMKADFEYTDKGCVVRFSR